VYPSLSDQKDPRAGKLRIFLGFAIGGRGRPEELLLGLRVNIMAGQGFDDRQRGSLRAFLPRANESVAPQNLGTDRLSIASSDEAVAYQFTVVGPAIDVRDYEGGVRDGSAT